MTPSELRTAADDLDRLEELEPRPGRVGLANRLRRGAEWLHTSRKPTTSQHREVSPNGEVSDAEVDAIAEAVFDLEANPQRWSTTTESMRTIYRASIRKALGKVRGEARGG